MTNLRYMTEEELLKFANKTPTKAQHYANILTKRGSITCATQLVEEVVTEYRGYMNETGVSFDVKLENAEEKDGVSQTKITIKHKGF